MKYMTEEEVDRLRILAFETNAERDKWNYYQAAAQWFNERDYRLLSDPLRQAAPDMLAEMQRYLPIIEHIERNPNFWREASRGTGLATANGYRAAIAKATGGV